MSKLIHFGLLTFSILTVIGLEAETGIPNEPSGNEHVYSTCSSTSLTGAISNSRYKKENGPANACFSEMQPQEPDSNIVPDWSEPIGFASIDGDNFKGPTTGGGEISTSDNIVYINGPDEFTKLVTLLYDRIKAYKNKSDYLSAKYAPLIIVMEEGVYTESGDIPNTGSVWGNSMLTIQEQGDLTIIGRGDAVLNFGINVKRSWNILIRNITFQDYYDDGVNIGEPETHHVWVDHCTFGNPVEMPADSEHPDGGCDIKNGASYITVSWCVFRNNWKTSLIGHSDNNGSTDIGRLKVTYYCNHFKHSSSRQPRVRFGEVHVLNCFYDSTLLYGIASANSAEVYAEANFFLNTVFPMYADRTIADFAAVYSPLESYTGNYPCIGLKQINNLYDDSGLSTILTGSFVNVNALNPGSKSIKFDELNPESVFEPALYYNYTTFNAAAVPDLVQKYAGAGKVDFFNVDHTGNISENEQSDKTFIIYPNPATDNINITFNGNSILKILNTNGQIVLEKRVSISPHIINIDEARLQPDFYIIIIENRSGRITSKLLIM